MGRWTQYDEDEYRLPEGMKRTGYDSDTGRYYFKGQNGAVWEGAEGAEFSEMTRVSNGQGGSSATRHESEDDVDVEATPTRPDGYQPLAADPSQTYRNGVILGRDTSYQTLLPFFLIIAVVLLLVWRLLLSPALSKPPIPCPITNTTAYWVQSGDSCWEISKMHGCTLEDLQNLNSEVDCGLLMPGTTLCLPSVTHN